MCYTFGIENVPPVEHFPMELIEPDPAYKPWYALLQNFSIAYSFFASAFES